METVSWKNILDEIALETSLVTYSSFFKNTKLSLREPGGWVVECPNDGVRFILEKKYKTLIVEKLKKHGGSSFKSVSVVSKGAGKENGEIGPLFPQKEKEGEGRIERSGLNPLFSFDNYAVSVSNQIAHAASITVANGPGLVYNPLFIWGGVGVGKTHLLHSIGRKIVENTTKKVLYCSAEGFTNLLVESIKNKSTSLFRQKMRNLDALLIDDIQFVSQRDFIQEELFHTFNALTTKKRQVVFTSDKPPRSIKNIERRLISRFLSGLVIDVQRPDFELKTAILLIKARLKKIDIDIETAKVVCSTLDDLREIEGFLLKVMALKNSGIDVGSNQIERLLSQSGVQQNKTTSSKDILREVGKELGISLKEIRSETRKKDIVFARHVCMYFLKTQTPLTYEEIAHLLGRKDHTTVLHGVQKIMNGLSQNDLVRTKIDKIRLFF
ncbi:MAG: chromosomal replication initiator protein DnaA [Candidatus Roizmanbacteria bacterium]|nr:chromosomal replication initiator protein DnaA [Candidatus Roizmanbacteria bacterium]